MTQRTHGRHRQPARLSTTTLTRSAAVAATSTGLLAGTVASASALPNSPQEPVTGVSGVPAADTLLHVAQTVAAAERPAVAAPAPEKADEAVSFGTSGFTAVDVVVQTPAAEQAEDALADRTTTAASRTEERTAPVQQVAAEPAPEPVAAPEPVQQAAPAPTGGILGIAAAYTGIYYVYGGSTPAGFDCSGYTQYVFAQAGISLPRTAAAQQASATPVSNPQPGDLVFFGYPAYHVGIYAGNGMMYDSGKPGIPTQLRAVFSGVSGYGRVG